jgi:hypothetical protein
MMEGRFLGDQKLRFGDGKRVGVDVFTKRKVGCGKFKSGVRNVSG